MKRIKNKKSINYTMKKALFLVFVILLCSLAISSSVTRTVSTSVPQGSDFYVTITAIVTSPDTIIAIDETLPTVFSIVDGNGGEGGQAYHLKWIETEAAGTIVYKYKLNAGNTPGTYTFSGKYIAENDTVEKSIIGNTSITVLEGTPICTAAHWKDTNGPCQEGNKLTTTWEQTTTCHDGVQHDPTEIQDCIYTPTCLDFNYTSWAPATCPSTEEQTRDITTKTPANCQGGNPILTQTCIYTPTCTEEHWTDTNTECQDNNTLTTTWAHTSCTGGIFHASPQIQACDYNTPTCIDFNYSLWTPSTCPLGGIQTRTITSTTPTVCQGGHPIKTRTCTYTPTCTIQDHWTSSDGNCQSNNFLTRTWTKTGTCVNGETPTSPEEISCNYNAQVC